MRIQELTNWAYGLTLAFTGLSAAAFVAASYSADAERAAVEQHLALEELADRLALQANALTQDVRLYIMTGNVLWAERFAEDEKVEKRLEESLDDLQAYEPSAVEREILSLIVEDAERLDALERQAIGVYRAGDAAAARDIVFGDRHIQLHTNLMSHVSELQAATAARTGAVLRDARFLNHFFGIIARLMLGLTGALFLAVLYFVLRKRVAGPLVTMAGAVRRLAQQDYDVELQADIRQDEIGEMNNALSVFRENGLERMRLDAERRKEQQTKDQILQMMHRIQACQSRGELAELVTLYLPQIFPSLSGALFQLNERGDVLQRQAYWGDPRGSTESFDVSDCWALRRGHPHGISPERQDVRCRHIDPGQETALCVPLSALGEMIGLLYFEVAEPDTQTGFSQMSGLYLELIAENIGLALANLDLREQLLDIASRDSLSGLLNRRSLNDALDRYSQTAQGTLTCMMLDIDYFKKFNDQFGHDAGDMVIKHVAQILRETLGEKGELYRFGGEEFTALLPDIAPEEAVALAEALRQAVSRFPLSHHGQLLGSITLSIGVARTGQGGPFTSLMNRADAALLRAKEGGRNRVETDEMLSAGSA